MSTVQREMLLPVSTVQATQKNKIGKWTKISRSDGHALKSLTQK